jgi:hypothetical protein
MDPAKLHYGWFYCLFWSDTGISDTLALDLPYGCRKSEETMSVREVVPDQYSVHSPGYSASRTPD